MKTYTLEQIQTHYREIFAQATVHPVLITKQQQPSHVILSAEGYQQLVNKLEELEDLHWGKQAQTALTESLMVGSDEFRATLETLVNGVK